MSRLAFLLALAFALSGCASAPDQRLPLGQLRLQAPLDIPAGAATVRLQYGRVTAFNAVQEQDPFCVFELDTVSERPQPVAPALFDIAQVTRSVETFSGMPVLPLPVIFGRDDRPSQVYYKTTFRLAPNPAGARALSCMSNRLTGNIVVMHHLTWREMRDALGGYFTLDLDGAPQAR